MDISPFHVVMVRLVFGDGSVGVDLPCCTGAWVGVIVPLAVVRDVVGCPCAELAFGCQGEAVIAGEVLAKGGSPMYPAL